ncbi:unnamed protein product [Amoebophrya sp. A120]|nr:unnamed protein product [Amoebophrya sp. A120]|eukprot:GSA120T00000921001.1
MENSEATAPPPPPPPPVGGGGSDSAAQSRPAADPAAQGAGVIAGTGPASSSTAIAPPPPPPLPTGEVVDQHPGGGSSQQHQTSAGASGVVPPATGAIISAANTASNTATSSSAVLSQLDPVLQPPPPAPNEQQGIGTAGGSSLLSTANNTNAPGGTAAVAAVSTAATATGQAASTTTTPQQTTNSSLSGGQNAGSGPPPPPPPPAASSSTGVAGAGAQPPPPAEQAGVDGAAGVTGTTATSATTTQAPAPVLLGLAPSVGTDVVAAQQTAAPAAPGEITNTTSAGSTTGLLTPVVVDPVPDGAAVVSSATAGATGGAAAPAAPPPQQTQGPPAGEHQSQVGAAGAPTQPPTLLSSAVAVPPPDANLSGTTIVSTSAGSTATGPGVPQTAAGPPHTTAPLQYAAPPSEPTSGGTTSTSAQLSLPPDQQPGGTTTTASAGAATATAASTSGGVAQQGVQQEQPTALLQPTKSTGSTSQPPVTPPPAGTSSGPGGTSTTTSSSQLVFPTFAPGQGATLPAPSPQQVLTPSAPGGFYNYAAGVGGAAAPGPLQPVGPLPAGPGFVQPAVPDGSSGPSGLAEHAASTLPPAISSTPLPGGPTFGPLTPTPGGPSSLSSVMARVIRDTFQDVLRGEVQTLRGGVSAATSLPPGVPRPPSGVIGGGPGGGGAATSSSNNVLARGGGAQLLPGAAVLPAGSSSASAFSELHPQLQAPMLQDFLRLGEQIHAHMSDLQFLEDENKTLNKRNKELSDRNAELEEQIEQHEEEMKEMEEKAEAKLDKERSNWAHREDEWNDERKKHYKEKEQLRQDKESLKEEQKRLKKEQKDAEKRCQEAENAVKDLKDEHDRQLQEAIENAKKQERDRMLTALNVNASAAAEKPASGDAQQRTTTTASHSSTSTTSRAGLSPAPISPTCGSRGSTTGTTGLLNGGAVVGDLQSCSEELSLSTSNEQVHRPRRQESTTSEVVLGAAILNKEPPVGSAGASSAVQARGEPICAMVRGCAQVVTTNTTTENNLPCGSSPKAVLNNGHDELHQQSANATASAATTSSASSEHVTSSTAVQRVTPEASGARIFGQNEASGTSCSGAQERETRPLVVHGEHTEYLQDERQPSMAASTAGAGGGGCAETSARDARNIDAASSTHNSSLLVQSLDDSSSLITTATTHLPEGPRAEGPSMNPPPRRTSVSDRNAGVFTQDDDSVGGATAAHENPDYTKKDHPHDVAAGVKIATQQGKDEKEEVGGTDAGNHGGMNRLQEPPGPLVLVRDITSGMSSTGTATGVHHPSMGTGCDETERNMITTARSCTVAMSTSSTSCAAVSCTSPTPGGIHADATTSSTPVEQGTSRPLICPRGIQLVDDEELILDANRFEASSSIYSTPALSEYSNFSLASLSRANSAGCCTSTKQLSELVHANNNNLSGRANEDDAEKRLFDPEVTSTTTTVRRVGPARRHSHSRTSTTGCHSRASSAQEVADSSSTGRRNQHVEDPDRPFPTALLPKSSTSDKNISGPDHGIATSLSEAGAAHLRVEFDRSNIKSNATVSDGSVGSSMKKILPNAQEEQVQELHPHFISPVLVEKLTSPPPLFRTQSTPSELLADSPLEREDEASGKRINVGDDVSSSVVKEPQITVEDDAHILRQEATGRTTASLPNRQEDEEPGGYQQVSLRSPPRRAVLAFGRETIMAAHEKNTTPPKITARLAPSPSPTCKALAPLVRRAPPAQELLQEKIRTDDSLFDAPDPVQLPDTSSFLVHPKYESDPHHNPFAPLSCPTDPEEGGARLGGS